MTTTNRITPGIVLVGGMRCGSTSLYRHLGAHPDVHESQRKETHFFDRNYERGWAWYEEQLGLPPAGSVVFEATPAYLASPEAVERLAAELPDAHLVVSLRDPVDRAQSHYWMLRERDHEQLELAEAIEAELAERRSLGSAERSYLRGGMYGPQLRRLYDLFPREQIHPIAFERYRREPGAVAAELVAAVGLAAAPDLEPPGKVNAYQRFRWVGLRKWAHRRLPKSLANVVGRVNRVDAAYPEMEPALRQRLREHFADSSLEAARLTGLDLATEWPSLRDG